MFKFGCILKNLRKMALLSNINQTHVQLKEVIIIHKLMKLDKMFTVKRRINFYKIQVRFIRSE